MTTPNEPSENSTPDRQAAHEFLTELRTRITTQPLPYQYGVEASALESLYKIFDYARAAIKKFPGCEKFASTVTNMLNEDLRPVTAKWHRAYTEGRLDSRDGADEFRADLEAIQVKLRHAADVFHWMAYDSDFKDTPTPLPLTSVELDALFADLPFGIPQESQLLELTTIDAINQAEAEEIEKRRKYYKNQIVAKTGHNAVGLALSGGGIRSATFSLGVVQVLADRYLLHDVDILSTVSGGGYTGSFLSQRLGTGASQSTVGSPHGPDPSAIQFLRHNVKFLAARNLKENWQTVATTLAGMILNWSAPLFGIVLLSIIAVLLERLDMAVGLPSLSVIFWGLAGLSVIAFITHGLSMRQPGISAEKAGVALGWITALTAFCGLLWMLVAGHEAIPRWINAHWQLSGSLGVLGALITAGPVIIKFLPVLKNPKVQKILMQALLWSAGILVPLISLVAFYGFWWLGATPSGLLKVVVTAIVLGLVAFYVLDINLTSPHRFYRDRLARTFIQTKDTDKEPVELHNLNPNQSAPYHLLNTTVNLPTSKLPALRDRRSDFFLFSKHWVGSPATGYQKTENWQASGNAIDLATAMAVSGAALSSYMGLGSMPSLTAILTLLNLRLGYWIKKPRTDGSPHPGFFRLIQEMLGISMSEKGQWYNLSDGGHIENMAVYELLRRRAKFIICVDGESDPEFTFGGLLTLVRHAQIDFGVTIKPTLDDMRLDSKTGLSRTHAHMCRIHYPKQGNSPEGVGLLLYLKLSVTGNESELIQRYRFCNPEFPHQTTLDQFFDEEQFEAYRQLGVHVAEGLFSKALLNGENNPTTMSNWFRHLSKNLLLPE